MNRNKRLNEIDVATGIAISLVVLGHLGWKDANWYFDFKNTLYKFHMPFFMFLSGFLLAYTNYHYSTIQQFKSFIVQKSIKFSLPYLFFSALFLFVHIGLGTINSSEQISGFVKAIFFYPKSGASGFLWYVYVLIEFYLFYALLYQVSIFRKNRWIYLLIGIAIFLFTPQIKYFELRNFANYSLFFVIGFTLQYYYDRLKKLLRVSGLFFLIIFLAIFTLDITKAITVTDQHRFGLLILGLSSLPALMYLSILLSGSKILQILGKSSFTIYLWNSVFIFIFKFIFDKFGFTDHFTFLVPIYILAGITGPLLLKHVVHKKTTNYIIRAIIP